MPSTPHVSADVQAAPRHAGRLLHAIAWLSAALGTPHAALAAAALPPELLAALRTNGSIDVVVEFDARTIDREAASQRSRLPRRIDDDAALARRAARYSTLKDATLRALGGTDIQTQSDYSHLPMSVQRVGTETALRGLAALSGVMALHPQRLHQRVLLESLPLIEQPALVAAGLRGAGSTVAVIDDGIDLSQVAFGGCTAVGTPAGCRIVAALAFVASPTTNHAHGTNVAAIVTGAATESRIASLNVFTTAGAPTSAILGAINWAIANRSVYNIVALNMSLGDGSRNASPCSGGAFASAIASARSAGLSVVVAAGNNAYENGAYVDGLNSPACSPGALSVGAVYDSPVGGLRWSGGTAAECTDFATAADQVTCFSNGASYLSLLAPGARIVAGGQNMGGTSQAAPHVTGALAMLRAAYPNESLADIESRLSGNGVNISDPRTGRQHARLNLRGAARPPNDDMAAAVALGAASGSATGSNRLATLESGETAPASGADATIWWLWTAPSSGQVSLDTAGSSFDTRLDVYTGNQVAALVRIAGNDDAVPANGQGTSSLRFQAQAGTAYRWAVAGAGATVGDARLQWSVNPTAQAQLSVTLNGPASALPGSTVAYSLTVSNAGPQSATGVQASVSIPAGLVLLGAPVGCTAAGSLLQCRADELTAGAALSFSFSLRVDSLAGPMGLTASVSSDVPDPTPADNGVTVSLIPADPASGDVPTLPPWGILLLGAVLLGSGWSARGRQALRGG